MHAAEESNKIKEQKIPQMNDEVIWGSSLSAMEGL
jgi:hypothetical protein